MNPDPPAWALDLMADIGRINARLARIEGGLVLGGFLAGLVVTGLSVISRWGM